jgi:hypothetical protein
MVEGRESNGDREEMGTVAQEDDAWECLSQYELPDTGQDEE